jgi:iron complex outermembrane receptor protein
MLAPFHYRQALLATLITTFAHIAVAEDAKLPTISVTAPPLADDQTLNASTIDAEELESLAPATSDTASLLRNVPGLSIRGSGGVSSLPVLHGLADDRLRIKVDGMDLISACHHTGQYWR